MQQNREDQIKYRTLPNFYYDTNDANLLNQNQLNRILDTNNYPYKNWHTVKKTYHPFRCHWGQRKLLFSEIEFFNKVQINSNIDLTQNYQLPPFYVVYVGSAVGFHIPVLLELFPALRFILYDPERFCNQVYNNKKIDVNSGSIGFFNENTAKTHVYTRIREYFNETRPQKLSPNSTGYEIIFISDIRRTPVDLCILEDMLVQQKWGIILNAYMMLLKFRLPYTVPRGENKRGDNELPDAKLVDALFEKIDDRIKYDYGLTLDYEDKSMAEFYLDHLKNDIDINTKIVLPGNQRLSNLTYALDQGICQYLYLEGDIYFQIDAPFTSTETRLLVKQQIVNNKFVYNMKFYDCNKYESQCLYFNMVENIKSTFDLNNGENRLIRRHLAGFDNGYANSAEYLIIREYITTIYPIPNQNNNIALRRIVSLLSRLNSFLFDITKRTLLECNIESYLKSLSILKSDVDSDNVKYDDFNLLRLIPKGLPDKIIKGIKQFLEYLNLLLRSMNIQREIFNNLRLDPNRLLLREDYEIQIAMIDNVKSNINYYLTQLEKNKTFSMYISQFINIRKLLDNYGIHSYDENLMAINKDLEIPLQRCTLDIRLHTEWDPDLSRRSN